MFRSIRSFPARVCEKSHLAFSAAQFMEPLADTSSASAMALVDTVAPVAAPLAPELEVKGVPSAPVVAGCPVVADAPAPTVEVRVAVVGNVDSGKSTLVGCLTKVRCMQAHSGPLSRLDCPTSPTRFVRLLCAQRVVDDGRGRARSLVFRFRHEQENGRTSSVATEVMGFTQGVQVPVDAKTSRAAAFQAVHAKADHSVTLVDLCGHERYLKTTVFGLTAMAPDYAMVIVGANMGVSKMTKVRGACPKPLNAMP